MRKLQQCFYSIVFIHSCGLNHQLQQGKKYILFQPSWLQVKRTGRVVLLVGAFRLPRPFRSLPGLNIRDHPNACIESHDIVFTLLSL